MSVSSKLNPMTLSYFLWCRVGFSGFCPSPLCNGQAETLARGAGGAVCKDRLNQTQIHGLLHTAIPIYTEGRQVVGPELVAGTFVTGGEAFPSSAMLRSQAPCSDQLGTTPGFSSSVQFTLKTTFG